MVSLSFMNALIPPRFIFKSAFLISLGAISLRAEMQTLTDQQGRSITVDVLSVEGDQAKIKRDDGRTFNLPLSTLIEADQKKLKEWAAKEAAKPKPIPANAIEVALSRAKFDSQKIETVLPYTITYTDGTVTHETRTRITATEQWGYSITLTNRTIETIVGLRAEYILFTGSATRPVKGGKSALPIGSIMSRERIVVKTGTVPLTKISYKGEMGKPEGDTLYGVWIRVYKDDTLLHESSSPEILRQTGTW